MLVVLLLVAVLLFQAVGYMEMKGDLLVSENRIKDLYHRNTVLKQQIDILIEQASSEPFRFGTL